MIPKEAGVDLLEKQRPLKLQEALRKITLSVRKDRMARAWTELGVCDEDQYAFLRGKSTIQPAMIKRLVLERAKHHGLDMVMLDVDLAKAYDSVDRWVKAQSAVSSKAFARNVGAGRPSPGGGAQSAHAQGRADCSSQRSAVRWVHGMRVATLER